MMKDRRSAVQLAVLLSITWLILTAGDPMSWLIGLPFLAIALFLQPDFDARDEGHTFKSNSFSKILGLVQFSFFFIVESVRGGLDVSRRVLAPQLNVNPIFFDYAVQLKLPSSQQFFIGCVSLLPGTLSADLINNELKIHGLDQHANNTQGVKRLEHLVGKIFGETL